MMSLTRDRRIASQRHEVNIFRESQSIFECGWTIPRAVGSPARDDHERLRRPVIPDSAPFLESPPIPLVT